MKTEEFKNITIAYMRNIGEYGSSNMQLMDDLKTFLKGNNLFNENTVILGIALDNPMLIPTQELRYDVGIILENDMKIGLETRQIDDGTYAIFEVPHTNEDVSLFWQSLPQHTEGQMIDDTKPIIERYAMEKVSNHLCEFCIPLK